MMPNKGCWMNLVLGIVGLPISYLLDSIFIGWLCGISFGYWACVKITMYLIKNKDASLGADE